MRKIIATILLTVLVIFSSVVPASAMSVHEFNELWKDDAYKTPDKKSKKKHKKHHSNHSKKSKKKTEVYACDDDEYKIDIQKSKKRGTIYYRAFGDWFKIGTGKVYYK